MISLEEYLKQAGNKSIFLSDELTAIYNGKNTLVMVEIIYNGLFDAHPYNIEYNKEQFIKILEMADKNVQNTIID